jgi:hypothetical protein
VIAAIGAVISGYIGMTVWKNKGGDPGGGFVLGALLGPSACSSSLQRSPGRRKLIESRDARDSFRVPTARKSSRAKRASAGTADVTSLPLRAVRRDASSCDVDGEASSAVPDKIQPRGDELIIACSIKVQQPGRT